MVSLAVVKRGEGWYCLVFAAGSVPGVGAGCALWEAGRQAGRQAGWLASQVGRVVSALWG